MLAVRKAMMGGNSKPEFVSATTATSGGGQSSISVPATTGATGLLEVVAIFNNATGTVTPPSGWTEVFDTDAAMWPSIALYWRYVTADDTVAQVFTLSEAVNRIAYIQARYKNAAFDAAAVSSVVSSANVVAPSITAKKGLVGVLAVLGSGSGSAVWTTPSGMADVIKGAGYPAASLFQREHDGGATGTTSVVNSATDHKRAATFSIKAK